MPKRVPFVPQMEAAECGAASLAMILGYHGHHAPLPEVRQACSVARDGASALAIVRAAVSYGLESQAVKAEMVGLKDLPLPCILHWNFNHFLVLERRMEKGVVLVDPASGRRNASNEQVSQSWTGVAVCFAPEAHFKLRPKANPSLSRYADLLRAALPSLAQVLAVSVMLQFVGLVFPVATQVLLDRVIVPRHEPWLWALGVGLGVAVLTKVLLSLVRAWAVQGLQVGLDMSLMGRFLQHLVRLPLGFFMARQTGDLVQRVSSNVEIRDLFSSRTLSAILDVFLLLGYALLMLAYSPRLGFIVLLIAGLRVGLLLLLRDRVQQAAASEFADSGRSSAALFEALTGLETIKASGAEERMAGRWVDRLINRLNAGLVRRQLEAVSSQTMVLLQGVAYAGIYFVGGREVLAERMTVGVFIAFLALQDLFMTPLGSLLNGLTRWQYAKVSLERLDDVLETEAEPTGSRTPDRLTGEILLEQTTFSYAPGAPAVVKGIDLHIRPGEKIALVGPSGAGKSTLARLMLGLHLPTSGRILFDGHDLRELQLGRIRNQVGVVLQETFFFDVSIRENLSLNDPETPLERLRWAADQACILDLIEGLPMGWNTRMGEDGGAFSGGQRQRLSLARALAHDPAMLLLDEATSSLDLPTEARLHANLARLSMTRVVIAHRLATVQDADRIIVMADGRIVQQGRFEDLARETGLFHSLVLASGGAHA